MLPIPCIVTGALVGARLNTAFMVEFPVNEAVHVPVPVQPRVPVQPANTLPPSGVAVHGPMVVPDVKLPVWQLFVMLMVPVPVPVVVETVSV
jgi:hypothetical protein